MREEQASKNLINMALEHHHLTTDEKPSIIIDKHDYSTFNFNKLKESLNNQGWDIINADNLDELKDAPPSMRLNKWLVYQL